MLFSASVLYTKHLTKKRKTYHDGCLTVDAAGSACLLDDAQQPLARAAVPASLGWTADTEGETVLDAGCWHLVDSNDSPAWCWAQASRLLQE